MLFVTQIKKSLGIASPFLIHIFMVVSVTAYTLFGAVVMRHIENTEIDRVNAQNGFSGPPPTSKSSGITERKIRDLSSNKGNKVVLSGTELSLLAPDLHSCVSSEVRNLIDLTKCDDSGIEEIIITAIDDCYRYAKIVINSSDALALSKAKFLDGLDKTQPQDENDEPWSFPNAVVFSYTVITTIGYGHIAPVSFKGRLFCIIYGLVGIPLTLLTIADIGMFMTKMVKKMLGILDRHRIFIMGLLLRLRRTCFGSKEEENYSESEGKQVPEELQSINESELEDSEDGMSDAGERTTGESVALAVLFFAYLILGAFVISLYEPDMGIFKAFYFIFVSCTTVGLGDLVPRSYKYLAVTFIYITLGLALTTMAVEIAADYLKKLHYFGRKIESVASVEVWFGGRKMKLKSLIHHLGDQFNVPVDDMANLNIDSFVDNAIKVTEGEIKTLRKPTVVMRDNDRPLSYRDLRKSGEPSIFFADERSSIVTGGSSDKPPLAEDTARTITTDPNRLY
uniref:Ion_trans_2 domain-containing protein n=1 Tax=Panagrellus redivivus TaxID=6233 RepID=A0A7E4VMC1_PANRE